MARTVRTLTAVCTVFVGFAVAAPANAAPAKTPVSCSAATNHGGYVASQPKGKRSQVAKSDCGKPTDSTIAKTTTTIAGTTTTIAGNTTTTVSKTPTVPTTKSQCKNDGWKTRRDRSGRSFKNQGDCVSFVATKGRNSAG